MMRTLVRCAAVPLMTTDILPVYGSKVIVMATWDCPGCSEPNTHAFDACWNCGCTRDGEPNPLFRVADDIDPRELPAIDPDRTYLPYPPLRKQFSLRLLFGILTFSGILAVYGRGLIGFGFVRFLFVWFLFGLIMIGLVYAASFVLAFIAFVASKRHPTSSVDTSVRDSATRPPNRDRE